ncbi:MAG: hypothetical protein Q9220_005355 [cf. Caloplaca sp. 1 TL-2023]
MPVNTQFQLGLELTNILNPLTSVVSALGSIALAQAIKKGGSDALTEIVLASVLGRNRIDPGMEKPFRQIVAKSGQAPLSKYLDIVLDSGAGPTVQTALQHPELLSMVIQLSLLCSSHEIISLAQAIVEAIERNVKELGTDLARVPDYVSLCSTLRVCTQDTSDFPWNAYYRAVGEKVRSVTGEILCEHGRRKSRASEFLENRTLPFSILQALLKSLHSLQQFPEESLLVIECPKGAATIIVWCYYILGLNVKLYFRDHEVTFGDSSPNVIIRQGGWDSFSASLLQPSHKNEPVFSLTNDESDLTIGPEIRIKVRGYGLNLMAWFSSEHIQNIDDCMNWAIGQSLRIIKSRAEYRKNSFVLDQSDTTELTRPNDGLDTLTEANIIDASMLLFDIKQPSQDDIWTRARSVSDQPREIDIVTIAHLMMLLFCFARVHSEDLKNCGDLPLLRPDRSSFGNRNRRCFDMITTKDYGKVDLGILDSFNFLSCLFHGVPLEEDECFPPVLINIRGWSLYFDSINILDPEQFCNSTLRIVRGVPIRNGVRKTRVVDGPRGLLLGKSHSSVDLDCTAFLSTLDGISTTRRGGTLIGEYGSDAFQVTKLFELSDGCEKPSKYSLGYRQMLEICIRFHKFPSCEHTGGVSSSFIRTACKYVQHEDSPETTLPEESCEVYRRIYVNTGHKRIVTFDQANSSELLIRDLSGHECIFVSTMYCKHNPGREVRLSYVHNNVAAKLIQMADIIGDNDRSKRTAEFIVRDSNTCFACAFKATLPANDHDLTWERNSIKFVVL